MDSHMNSGEGLDEILLLGRTQYRLEHRPVFDVGEGEIIAVHRAYVLRSFNSQGTQPVMEHWVRIPSSVYFASSVVEGGLTHHTKHVVAPFRLRDSHLACGALIGTIANRFSGVQVLQLTNVRRQILGALHTLQASILGAFGALLLLNHPTLTKVTATSISGRRLLGVAIRQLSFIALDAGILLRYTTVKTPA